MPQHVLQVTLADSLITHVTHSDRSTIGISRQSRTNRWYSYRIQIGLGFNTFKPFDQIHRHR